MNLFRLLFGAWLRFWPIADMFWCGAPPLPVMVAAVNFKESRSET
jgi:hypothetical protein